MDKKIIKSNFGLSLTDATKECKLYIFRFMNDPDVYSILSKPSKNFLNINQAFDVTRFMVFKGNVSRIFSLFFRQDQISAARVKDTTIPHLSIFGGYPSPTSLIKNFLESIL